MSDDFMGGMFNFDGDGKTDTGEEFMAYQMFDESTKKDSSNKSFTFHYKKHHNVKFWHVILIILLVLFSISIISNPYNQSSYSASSYRSSNYSRVTHSSYSSSFDTTSTKALTKEEANKLRGTGYHGTKPNSSAENMELAAAQVKCKKCGKHSTNGLNSMCNACRKKYGGN